MIPVYKHELSEEEISLLKSLLGKEANIIQHQKFTIAAVSTGFINFQIEGKWYGLMCDLYGCDFMGKDDELAFFTFLDSRIDYDYEKTNVEIKESIKEIDIVNDKIEQYKGDTKISELNYTRALIFVLESKQYAFYIDWHYSELIYIRKGQNCLEQIPSPNHDWAQEDWLENYSSVNSRSIIRLK